MINLFDLIKERRHLSRPEFSLRSLIPLSLGRLNDQHATFWRQRGNVKQCILGDKNTAYHHQCATIRFQKNKIKSLSSYGLTATSHSAKALILHDFYTQLLGSMSPSPLTFELCSHFSSSALDSSQAASLISPFDASEVRLALLGMNSNASPGPDGFGPAFFKKFWDLSKQNLLSFLSDFHSCHADLGRVNKKQNWLY